MSILTSGLRANAPAPQDPAQGESVFGQALNTGLRNAGAGLTALGGTALDAVGATDTAKGLYDTSAGLRAAATAGAPRINSIRQVNDVGSGLEYGVGLLGQSIPALGVGLGGALVSGNPLVGATLATAPLMAGDVASRQQEDPTIAALPAGQRLASAAGTGLATAALSNAVPVAMGGKLLGRGLAQEGMGLGRNVATNLAEAVGGNAAAGALGEKLTQQSLTGLNAARDTSHDEEALIDAAAGGAAMGVPFAGAGIAGQAAFGKRATPRTDGVRVDGAAPAAEAGTPAGKPAPTAPDGGAPAGRTEANRRAVGDEFTKPEPSTLDRIKGAFKKDDGAVEMDLADRIAKNQETVDADMLRNAPPGEHGTILEKSDNDRMGKVKDWASKMYEDASLTPESRAAIDDFMANPADRTKQAGIAAMQQARSMGESAAKAAKDFFDSMSSKFKDTNDGEKLSSVDSPKLHASIADTVAPALAERWPALVQNDTAMKSVTSGLSRVMDAMQKTGRIDEDVAGQLRGWFGKDAPSVMAALHSSVLDSADAAGTERYYRAVNDLSEAVNNGESLTSKMRAALPEELRKGVTDDQMSQMSRGIRDFVEGRGNEKKPKSQIDFEQKQIEASLRETFGDKTDSVLDAFRKDSERRRKLDGVEQAVETDPEQGVNARSSADMEADAEPVQYHGAGKDKANPQPIKSPEAHRAEFDNAGQAERLMRELQAENPDRVVQFTHVKDMEPAERAKYPDAGPDDGFVTVEGTRDETRLTPDEFKKMRVDTSKTSHAQNNPSRIDTGVHGAVIDARAIVKAMKGKLDYVDSDNISARHRTARAFMEGIAAVQDHLGKSFDIPDETVIAPGFTYGEAKTLSMRRPDPEWMKGKSDEAINAELVRRDNLGEMNDRELNKATIRAQDIVARREASYQAKVSEMRQAGSKLRSADLKQLRIDSGLEEARGALHAAEREAAKREAAVRKEGNLDSEGRTEVGADEQIHRAAESHGEGDLARRTGLDDNPLHYSNFVERNPDGSLPKAIRSAIDSKLNRMENMKTGDGKRVNTIAQRVAAKARLLLDNLDKMKVVDQALLASIVKDGKIASISETVNDLHDRYAARWKEEPAKDLSAGGFPTDLKTRTAAQKILAPSKLAQPSGEVMRAYEKQRARFEAAGKSVESFERAFAAHLNIPVETVQKLSKLYKEGEGTAPKKANAFVERVLGEGDLTSVKDAIKKSDAPKDLQRAIDALVEHVANPRAREVLDAANERMAKLIEADQDVAYSMQRNKPLETGSTSEFIEHAMRGGDFDPAEMTKSLVKAYAPTMRILVVVNKDLPGHGMLERKWNGSFWLHIKPNANKVQLADTIAHEFGHALQYHLFDNAAPEVQAKIRGEYDALMARYEADDSLTLADYIRDFGSVPNAFADGVQDAMRKGVTAKQIIAHINAVNKKNLGVDGYATMFDEYFANQFAKYISSGAENAPPAVRSFWATVAKTLKDFYNNVVAKMLPNTEFKAWVDSLAVPRETTDPDVAYSMQRADPNAPAHTAAQHDAVDAYVERVLGKSVDLQFRKLLHAGEFLKAGSKKSITKDTIRLSVYSLDPLSVAHHESLHAWLTQLRRDGLMDDAHPLMKAANSTMVQARLRELLAGEPAALRQLSNLEERAAYMYQFWAAGKLALPAKPAGVLGHIADFFKSVLGIWTNDQRATHIMEYFNSGEYAKNMADRSAVARALNEGTNASVEHFKTMLEPLARLGDAVAATGNGRLRGSLIPSLIDLADKVYAPLQGEHDDPGYVPAARAKRTQVLNNLANKIGQYDAAVVTDALKSLQQGVKGASPEERIVIREVRKTLRDMHDYMTEAGVQLGDLGEDYFPRVWEPSTILEKETEFRAMMKHYQDSGAFTGSVDRIIAVLTRADGSDLQVETVKPGMQYSKERVLGFISALDAEPFLRKNLYDTLNSYVSQATRRAEWARRFKDDGSGLHDLLARAREEGASKEDLQLASDYLQGVDGTLGDKISPKLRRAFGNMIVYQNVRVLPLAIFSSLIDPMGVLVRGGTVGEAFNTMKRGFAEIPKGFKKGAPHDDATKLAAQLGVIDNAVLMHTIGSSFSQGMTSNFGRRVNDAFFKYNLMEQFNTSMRVGASEAAIGFLGRHADGTASPHSARWLGELGLKSSDVIVKNGRPLLSASEFEAAGYSADQALRAADKMTLAVNKWVDGAILRPNAAHKPVWMNDPHFAVISHLKQFVYSFQETILKRVANEVRHGNVGPAYALAAYVPFMLAADLAKGVIVGGGSQPSSRDSWDASDYAFYEVQRAGLFGVGQFGVDAVKDLHRGGLGIGALSGPTLEQLGEAVKTVAGPEQFQTFALNAMPANALFDAAESAATNAID